MKKIILVLLFVMPFASFAQKGGETENPDIYAERASVRFDNGDDKGAVALLKKGAKLGSAKCCNYLGDYYNEQEDYKAAAKYYTQAGDAEGRFSLGSLYLVGSLGKQTDADMMHGLDLVRSAEREDYRDAIYVMARLFDAGAAPYVEQNYDSAIFMLNRLVAKEDPYALFAMAGYYETGSGVPKDSLEAMRYLERAGAAGLSDGYAYLGDYYRHGLTNLTPDSTRAFLLYQQAAAVGEDNANGLFAVAVCYLQGIGTRMDSLKAIPYLQDAVDAGSAAAAGVLGDFYNYGRAGVKPDGDTALMLYQLASQGDDPRGDYMMGAYLYERGAYDNAMGFLQSAINHGSVDAAVLYAQALFAGNGVERNPEQAVEILRQTAPLDPSGQSRYLLGLASRNGVGMPKDEQLAFRYMDTAASMGNTSAMMGLGQFYVNSTVVPQDTVKAVEWYERAAAAGSTRAMMLLAGSYRQGRTAPRNPQRAFELYRMAADQGNLDALCRVGLCHELAEGTDKDLRRAYACYSEAAERGSAWGMRLLADCYAQGLYVEYDMQQAAEWFQRAAEAGDVQSCYVLGQLYLNGEGVKKNKKEARRWLQVAADAGHQQAADLLKTL
ncbi:MAG: sel1 repeat family protein [Bacteroidales bacterium]|nr:sel1 repeat family protein [Bacteroidales bacterium]